ncbi:hypothetical protein BC629DRAFT_910832 [Irpex lacteus]|nr:hypothetical protein BC629DRAFT_910832 [Irpex lacteus]
MLSTPGAADCAAYCVYWENKYASNYFQIAATTLFFCDYLATLSQELRCIWGREVSLTSLLFLMNRLIALFRLGDVCAILEYLVLSVFAALRTYALWNKNRGYSFLSGFGASLPRKLCICFNSTQFQCCSSFKRHLRYYQTLPEIQTAKFGDNVTLLTSILVSRFILDLREAYATRGSGPSSGQGASFYIFDLTSIRFASEVDGNIPELGNVVSATLSVKEGHNGVEHNEGLFPANQTGLPRLGRESFTVSSTRVAEDQFWSHTVQCHCMP